MNTLQCPECGSAIAAAHGANEAQCFGCGKMVKLQAPAATESSNTAGGGVMIAIVVGIAGLLMLLLIAGVGVYFLVAPTRVETTQADGPNEASASTPAEPSRNEPAVVATAEERRLAETVPAGVRGQIIGMWDQMSPTTRKKILLPKGSVLRDRTEALLGGIEDRELTRIAALHDLKEEQVRAVIQVHMADKSSP